MMAWRRWQEGEKRKGKEGRSGGGGGSGVSSSRRIISIGAKKVREKIKTKN